MHKLTAIAGIAAASLGLQTTAFGYSATANVTFSWATGGSEFGWIAGGVNTLAPNAVTNANYFSQTAGFNSVGFYNSEFATVAGCAAAVADPSNTAGWDGGAINTRKYGCRFGDALGDPASIASPVGGLTTTPPGNGPGASASGTITVTDTTLTGTITINSTTDVPTGGTASSVGTGTNGYNLRASDGSPFLNSWNGVTTTGTYVLNLTGTFTATSWQITGGTARFSNVGFLCQQGGNSSPANILCSPSLAPGGYNTTGASLSWGWDLDGGAGASTAMGEIDVLATSGVLITTLSGVLANLSVDGLGNITTNSGEIRRALGSTSGCGQGTTVKNITYDFTNTRVSCGSLTVADLVVSGNLFPEPDPFSFQAQNNVPLATVITSNTITVTGLSTTGTISVANGEYSLGCTPVFTQAPGTIAPGGTVCVRQTSAMTPATTTTTTLTIGGTSGIFVVTTFPADTTPDSFTFIDQTNVGLATATTSLPVTITGINAGTQIAVATGEYSIGCTGTFTAASGTISNNQTVCVRQTSSPAPDTTTDTVLTIGGVSDTFSVTTVPADTTPDPFAFVDRVDVQEGTVITSAPVTITGINTPAPISVLGGTYSIGCGASFTGVAGSIPNGASVCVRHTSAISQTTETSTTLTIGGVSDTFTSTTVLTFATRNDSATTLVNTPVQINVLANDVGYSDPVILSISTPPTGGTAVVTGSPGVQAGVRITYTPAPGFQGTDSFVYAVEDNALSGTATVAVTVTSDTDGDGILDSADNCLGVSNANQRDTNGDGYGNICDPDFNNNGIVDSQDGALLKARFGSTTHPDQDLNGNGIVDSNDGARLKAKFGKAPGPSGLHP